MRKLLPFAFGLLVVGAPLVGCSAGTGLTLVEPDGGATDAAKDDAAVPTIDAKDYTQTCKADADCVLVNEALCGPCIGHALPTNCGGSSAINLSDKDKFAADFVARQAQCPMVDVPAACPAICEIVSPYCNAGKCSTCNGTAGSCSPKDGGGD